MNGGNVIRMNRRSRVFIIAMLLFCLSASTCTASYGTFQFEDTRFQGSFTTENMDLIMQEYELNDGWFWTTSPFIIQTFHGAEDAPGWTDTSANSLGKKQYKKNMYGCRWLSNKVIPELPSLGYGECFGFAQFLGYLLSGDYNLYKSWKVYRSVESAKGLKVGDVVRSEFYVKGRKRGHSAVVYSVSQDQVLFIQASGGNYNCISVGTGFNDGYHDPAVTEEAIASFPNYKICRSLLNCE